MRLLLVLNFFLLVSTLHSQDIITLSFDDSLISMKIKGGVNGANIFLNLNKTDYKLKVDSMNRTFEIELPFYVDSSYSHTLIVTEWNKKFAFEAEITKGKIFFRQIKKKVFLQVLEGELYIRHAKLDSILFFRSSDFLGSFKKEMKRLKRGRVFNLKPRSRKASP